MNPLDAVLVNGELIAARVGEGDGLISNEDQAQICTDFLTHNPDLTPIFGSMPAGCQLDWVLLESDLSKRAYLQASTKQRLATIRNSPSSETGN